MPIPQADLVTEARSEFTEKDLGDLSRKNAGQLTQQRLIIPKSCSFYTKVAKSAKKLTTSNSCFADLATFV